MKLVLRRETWPLELWAGCGLLEVGAGSLKGAGRLGDWGCEL
jgi:hypothetical protein